MPFGSVIRSRSEFLLKCEQSPKERDDNSPRNVAEFSETMLVGELKMAILDTECQIAFFTATDESITHLHTIKAICTELDLPLCVTNSLIIDAKALQEIEAKLSPHSGIACRPRLLVAGSFLEEQITICALHAVYVGFEVFLLRDFIVPKNLDQVNHCPIARLSPTPKL